MFESLISQSPIVQGGLTLMVAGWLGYQLREVPNRVLRLLRVRFTRVIEVREEHPLYDAWLEMLSESAIRRGGPRTLQVRSVSDDRSERAADARFVAGADSFWAKVGGMWCRVEVGREPGASRREGAMERFIISAELLGATADDLASLLREAKSRARVPGDRQFVDVCNKYGGVTTRSLPKRHPDTLCLPAGFFAQIADRIGAFLTERERYELRGIPWRFGVLLHGAPGAGKTSLAHALASHHDLRLAVIPLADLKSDEELFDSFSAVREGSVILIEDIDCAFKGRSAEDADRITFSGLLNCIDGMLAPSNGRVLIMSTNHPEHLDPALIRPGRVDLSIEAPSLTIDAATEYVDRVFPHLANRHDIVAEVLEQESPTPAMLLNRLIGTEFADLHTPVRSRPASPPTHPRTAAPYLPARWGSPAHSPPRS